MSARRVLVTGASGFVGRALCRALLARGCTVVALCRRPDPDLPPGVGRSCCDLLDRPLLESCLRDVRADDIVHLAGATSARRELDAVLETFDANLLPTVNLLHAATRVGCARLILAGSLEEPEPPAVASSPYAAAKLAGSLYARMFHELYRTPVAVARIFMVYGPGQSDLRKLIPHSILSLQRGTDLPLTSGRREVDWIYIDDVVRGLLAMLAAPAIDGATLDLGTGVLTSVRTVVETVRELVPSGPPPRFGALPDRSGEQVRRADVEASARRLGWRARVPLREGLTRTVRYYSELLRPAA